MPRNMRKTSAQKRPMTPTAPTGPASGRSPRTRSSAWPPRTRTTPRPRRRTGPRRRSACRRARPASTPPSTPTWSPGSSSTARLPDPHERRLAPLHGGAAAEGRGGVRRRSRPCEGLRPVRRSALCLAGAPLARSRLKAQLDLSLRERRTRFRRPPPFPSSCPGLARASLTLPARAVRTSSLPPLGEAEWRGGRDSGKARAGGGRFPEALRRRQGAGVDGCPGPTAASFSSPSRLAQPPPTPPLPATRLRRAGREERDAGIG